MTPPNKQALAQLLRIEDVIDRDGYQLVRTGRNQMRSKVHDSLVVNTAQQSFWWYSLRERGTTKWCGDVYNWFMATRGVDFREASLMVDELANGASVRQPVVVNYQREPEPQPEPLPQDLHLRLHTELERDAAARAWWHRQGIGDAAIEHFSLGVVSHAAYGRAYTIPVTEGGVLVNMRLRLDQPSGPNGKDKYRPFDRGRGSQLFNADVLTPDRRGAVVVAGEKKAIVLWQYGIPAVSSTAGCGTWRGEWTERFRHCRKVFFAYDPGETEHAYEHAACLAERGIVIAMPDKPDDYVLRHGVAAFRCLLSQAIRDTSSLRTDTRAGR
jgi:hypothetical protein